MRRPGAVLAALAGLLVGGAVAAPAAAEHPEPAPVPFTAEVVGEDGCTVFATAGQAAWPAVHPPESEHVSITGTVDIGWESDDEPRPCNPVINAYRQMEFTGHVNDWNAVEYVVPMTPDLEYAFDLEAPGGGHIEYVTMRICTERRADGSDYEGRCGATVLIQMGETAPEHCRFTPTVTANWYSGYIMDVRITAVERIEDWYAVITFPSGQALTQVWNGDVTEDGSQIIVRPSPWNRQIQAGASTSFGFIGSGTLATQPVIEVWADGVPCART